MHRTSRLLLPLLMLSGGLTLACGPTRPAHKHPEPLSAEEHEQHAKAHDAEAQISNQQVEPQSSASNDVQCVDVGGPLDSGGERTPVMKPCWTRAEQNASYLRSSEAHRKAADDHRHWSKQLVELEQTACKTLGEIERTTSPFVRSPDILSVEEYKEGGNLLGARVTFRKVKGLSKEWLTTSIGCHQARAAKLGYAKEFMPHCPLTLKHTGSSVEETADTVVVTLRSEDPIIAAQIYGRALSSADDTAQK